MAGFYNEFEKRFTNNWFSANWSEVEVKSSANQSSKKDLQTLQEELKQIEENIETISQKQLRLSNLAKLYQ